MKGVDLGKSLGATLPPPLLGLNLSFFSSYLLPTPETAMALHIWDLAILEALTYDSCFPPVLGCTRLWIPCGTFEFSCLGLAGMGSTQVPGLHPASVSFSKRWFHASWGKAPGVLSLRLCSLSPAVPYGRASSPWPPTVPPDHLIHCGEATASPRPA